MSYSRKLGYDVTNFSDAISDLGKCELETRRLERTIAELNEKIAELEKSKLMMENLYAERQKHATLNDIDERIRNETDKTIDTKNKDWRLALARAEDEEKSWQNARNLMLTRKDMSNYSFDTDTRPTNRLGMPGGYKRTHRKKRHINRRKTKSHRRKN